MSGWGFVSVLRVPKIRETSVRPVPDPAAEKPQTFLETQLEAEGRRTRTFCARSGQTDPVHFKGQGKVKF